MPSQRREPTEHNPEEGQIVLFDVVLSDVEHWIEDGDHVFRSLEFDVIAGAPDLRAAVWQFITKASGFAVYLDELEDLAENEHEMRDVLAGRLLHLLPHLEPFREAHHSPAYGDHGDYRPALRPRTSSQLSRV